MGIVVYSVCFPALECKMVAKLITVLVLSSNINSTPKISQFKPLLRACRSGWINYTRRVLERQIGLFLQRFGALQGIISVRIVYAQLKLYTSCIILPITNGYVQVTHVLFVHGYLIRIVYVSDINSTLNIVAQNALLRAYSCYPTNYPREQLKQ